MRLIKWLNKHFEETLMILLLVVIACVSLAQVIIRKLPWVPALKWAEEFCRFCWIWSVFLSLPYTILNKSMLRVGILLDIMPQKLQKVLNIFVDLVVIASMGLLFYYSITVVGNIRASGETSAAMLWPMWLIYSIMLVGFFLSVVRGIQQLIEHLRGVGKREQSMLERTLEEAQAEAQQVKEGTR